MDLLGKKTINSESLNASVDGIVSAFTKAVVGLSNVVSDATTKQTENSEQIKKLETENEALKATIERASNIKDKLSSLLS